MHSYFPEFASEKVEAGIPKAERQIRSFVPGTESFVLVVGYIPFLVAEGMLWLVGRPSGY